jgi:hypothetical protein
MTGQRQGPGYWKVGRILKVALLVCAASGLSACSTQNLSYLDGYRWSTVELNTYDTIIISVDGQSYPYNSKILVDPGVHHILFETTPAAGFAYSPRKALDIDIKPCTRYWFEAKRVNPVQQDFEPRVNYKEPIGGCGIASSAGA